MSAPISPSLAQRLRSTRLQAGLSQEVLAERAGVHVRTIRGLETGVIALPRRRTLELIASALDFDAEHEYRLLEQWGYRDVGARHRSTARQKPNTRTYLDEFVESAAATSRVIALSEALEISSQRCPVRRRTEEVILALQDVTEHRVYFEAEEAQDLDLVDISELQNCTLAATSTDAGRRTKMFTVALDQLVQQGETQVLRYTISIQQAVGASLPKQGRAIGGFFHSPHSYVLEVRFQPEALPRVCTQIFQPRPSGPIRQIRPVPVGDTSTCHLALARPNPGGHGIAWEW